LIKRLPKRGFNCTTNSKPQVIHIRDLVHYIKNNREVTVLNTNLFQEKKILKRKEEAKLVLCDSDQKCDLSTLKDVTISFCQYSKNAKKLLQDFIQNN
jgi:ribosomal protein L15